MFLAAMSPVACSIEDGSCSRDDIPNGNRSDGLWRDPA